MKKRDFIEFLEELQYNVEREIRVFKEADNNNFTSKDLIDSIVYILDCSNIEVSDQDIKFIDAEISLMGEF